MSVSGVIRAVMAAVVVIVAVAGAPSRPASAALARVLVPVVRHRLEEGGILLPRGPRLMEELVTDLEEADPQLRHLHEAAVAGKREFDDYGHMRFGKRTEVADYDDYGHLRFGRSADGVYDDDEEKYDGSHGINRQYRRSIAVPSPLFKGPKKFAGPKKFGKPKKL